MAEFDSVLLIAFGGPERMEDVRPFIANVLKGRAAPPERVEAVVRHYEQMGGRSPLNEITFKQAEALRIELARRGRPLPVFVGMRNWYPFIADQLRTLTERGCKRAVGLVLSAQQSEAGWERYVAETLAACREVSGAPAVEFCPGWHAHELFVAAVSDRLQSALRADASAPAKEGRALVFTAHSIPVRMATSNPYAAQIAQGAERVARACGFAEWSIAYQSRSGNPHEPWLEPDILDALRSMAARGVKSVVIVPIGFVCDHVEVLYDLDIEAKGLAAELGIEFLRVPTVNDHPLFIEMMADVILRRIAEG